MTRFATPLLGAALSLALALPLAAQDTATTEAPTVSADTVLVSVNGEDITLGHLIAARMALPDQYQALPDDVLFDGLLEQLIQQTVLGQAIDEVSKSVAIRVENERRALVAGQMLDNVLADAVTDEALQAAYDEHFADAEPTKEYNASHILVETEDEAKVLITELEAGADFATLAVEHSTGPSGPNGGELPWFSAGMMVEPFEEAVLKLEVGQISPPVQTQFGWHVVKLNDTRMKGAPPLEEVKTDLIELIENNAVDTAVKQLVDAAAIERADTTGIDPSVLRDNSLIE